MIPTAEKSNIISSMGEGMKFGVSEEGAQHIFNLLTEKLYTDKPWALVREYGTNAMDANIMAGRGDKPIQITMPVCRNPYTGTQEKRMMSIRDYGNGLDHNEMEMIYTQLGESTKRLSNETTGQMGIGCKAGFAYGPFTIVSIKNGKKTIYRAAKNENGIPTLYSDSCVPTIEPSGLEIIFEIRPNDIEHTRNRILFFRNFAKVKPILINANGEDKDFSPILSGNEWKIFGHSNVADSLNIVMGNICYPCRDSELLAISSRFIRGAYSLVLYVNMGEVSFSSSREELEYTDLTKRNVKRYLSIVENSLRKQVEDSVAKMDNIFAVFKHIKQLQGACTISKFTWNGKEWDTRDNQFEKIKGASLYLGHRRGRQIRYTVSDLQNHPKDPNDPKKGTFLNDKSHDLSYNLINGSPKIISNLKLEKLNPRIDRWKMMSLEKISGISQHVIYIESMPAEYGTVKAELDWDTAPYEKPVTNKAKYEYSLFYLWNGTEWEAIDEEEIPDGKNTYVPITVRYGKVVSFVTSDLKIPFDLYGIRTIKYKKLSDDEKKNWIPFHVTMAQHIKYEVSDYTAPFWVNNISQANSVWRSKKLGTYLNDIKGQNNQVPPELTYTVQGAEVITSKPSATVIPDNGVKMAKAQQLLEKFFWFERASADVPTYQFGKWKDIFYKTAKLLNEDWT